MTVLRERSLKELMEERKQLSEQIITTKNDRVKTLEELREIIDDAAHFLPNPYKFHDYENGYYIFISFSSEHYAIEKRITVQKRWNNVNLLAISDDEFTTIYHLIETELKNKYTEQLKKEQATINAMK